MVNTRRVTDTNPVTFIWNIHYTMTGYLQKHQAYTLKFYIGNGPQINLKTLYFKDFLVRLSKG